MGRYTGPKYKIQRRLGVELPGLGKPGATVKRPNPPGMVTRRRRKLSDYAVRLHEKQKLRHHYGLGERQLRRFIRMSKKGMAARRHPQGWPGRLVGILESRVDNVVFRAGYARSMQAARQLVSHGHVYVNGKRLDIPSAVIKVGDTVALADKAFNTLPVKDSIDHPRLEMPDYLQFTGKDKKGVELVAEPQPGHIPFEFELSAIAEIYSGI
jgi:small subunit ribosomal protein S4